MVTYENSTVSNGDVTVNVMETNISIDMTVIIVTTRAATLDYGIDVEVEIVIVAIHVISAAIDRAVHPAARRTTAMVAASRLRPRASCAPTTKQKRPSPQLEQDGSSAEWPLRRLYRNHPAILSWLVRGLDEQVMAVRLVPSIHAYSPESRTKAARGVGGSRFVPTRSCSALALARAPLRTLSPWTWFTSRCRGFEPGSVSMGLGSGGLPA